MLINTGDGSYANLDQIYAIIPYEGAVASRLRRICAEQNLYYALNGGGKTRSLIIFNNGMVMGSSLKTETLKKRGNSMESLTVADKYEERTEIIEEDNE